MQRTVQVAIFKRPHNHRIGADSGEDFNLNQDGPGMGAQRNTVSGARLSQPQQIDPTEAFTLNATVFLHRACCAWDRRAPMAWTIVEIQCYFAPCRMRRSPEPEKVPAGRKAAEGRRSPRRAAITYDFQPARSVVECASPLALSKGTLNGCTRRRCTAHGPLLNF